MLIDVQTLRERLPAGDLRVFDCRFNLAEPEAGWQAYVAGHIPGAQYAHLETDLSGAITPQSGRHPLPEPAALVQCLRAWGVNPDSQVVAYDDKGGAMASRLWWLLRWLGHERVALLDGGLAAWTAQGGELETALPPARPAGRFVARPRAHAWLASGEVASGLRAGELCLLDARGAARFRGEQEPIDPVAGHVPGALNLPFEGNLDVAGRFLSAGQLRKRFLTVLVNVEAERVVHMCGSGVTACHNLLAMELAGLGGSRLYPGSWSEWIRDPARPVAQGNA